MYRTKKKTFRSKPDPVAETLREQKFRQRVVHPKHIFDRKKQEQLILDEDHEIITREE